MITHARKGLKTHKYQHFGDEIIETRADTHCGYATSPNMTSTDPKQVTCESCLRNMLRLAGVKDTRNVTKRPA